jgi:hypothetical protein
MRIYLAGGQRETEPLSRLSRSCCSFAETALQAALYFWHNVAGASHVPVAPYGVIIIMLPIKP